jgi:hypothetical protein
MCNRNGGQNVCPVFASSSEVRRWTPYFLAMSWTNMVKIVKFSRIFFETRLGRCGIRRRLIISEMDAISRWHDKYRKGEALDRNQREERARGTLVETDSSPRLCQPIIRDSMVKYLDPFESWKRLLKRFLKPTTIQSRHGSRCLPGFACTCAMWTKLQASGPVALGGTDCISGEPDRDLHHSKMGHIPASILQTGPTRAHNFRRMRFTN